MWRIHVLGLVSARLSSEYRNRRPRHHFRYRLPPGNGRETTSDGRSHRCEFVSVRSVRRRRSRRRGHTVITSRKSAIADRLDTPVEAAIRRRSRTTPVSIFYRELVGVSRTASSVGPPGDRQSDVVRGDELNARRREVDPRRPEVRSTGLRPERTGRTDFNSSPIDTNVGMTVTRTGDRALRETIESATSTS